MKFQTKNELDRVSFRDSRIMNFHKSGDDLVLNIEGLIILPSNSQNQQFSASYAGGTEVRFTRANVTAGVKEGYKLYNANEELVEEVEDVTLNEAEVEELLKQLDGSWLYDVQTIDGCESNVCVWGIEMPGENEEDPTEMTDSYQLKVTYEDVEICWEKYLSKVMV